MEQLANLATSTLNGGISGSVTSLTVTSATGFPTTGEFRIMIDSEIIIVGTVSGTTYSNLQRGAEGTVPAAHSNGATITCILTEDALSCFRRDNAQLGAYSSVSTAVKDGRLVFTNNSPYLLKDKGSSMLHSGPLWKLKKPNDGDFVWANQSPATVTVTNGGILLATGANASLNINIRKKNAPATPYSVKMLAYPRLNCANYNLAGICFRESATGKMSSIEWVYSSGAVLQFDNWNSTSSQAGGTTSYYTRYMGQDINWLGLSNDGTNITHSFSLDGFNFYPFKTVAKNSFFTTGPDEIGFMVASFNGTYGAGLFVASWEEY